MSSEDDKQKRAQSMVDASMMSTERPLDSLLPELRNQAPKLPKQPLNPRVLDVERETGYEWVLALWADPGSTETLHEQTRKLLEATMVAELTRAPFAGESLERKRSGIRLEAFSTVEGDIQKATRAFGFKLTNDSLGEDSLEEIRQEGLGMGWDVPDKPVSSWFAEATPAGGEKHEALLAIHREMREKMENDVWGRTPGGPSKLAATLIERELGRSITPSPDGLREFENLLVRGAKTGVIRWIPPLLFQALCDFVGVVLSHHYNLQVEWAECEPEEGDYGPPPVFRIAKTDGTHQHLPIGVHLLRWCVMPVLEGDEIPPLSEWLEFEFGSGAH